MAKRKPNSGSPTAAKPGGASRPGVSKPTAGRPSAATKPPVGRPPAKRKPGKSIVNQRQTPWGLIATVTAIVIFAAAIVTFAVVTHKSAPAANAGCSAMTGNSSQSYLNELNCAKDIQGVTFKQESNLTHVTTTVTYDSTPPVGGNHSPYWADCDGTVYPTAIANENAVHMLEHGAVWITYNPSLPATDVATLVKLVTGKHEMAMSPYPDLSTPISLQSWGYQLKVSSATDPRIQKFIDALRFNPKTTPEYGATCQDTSFITHPSTFGHPLSAPA